MEGEPALSLFEMLSYIAILEGETRNHWNVLIGVTLPLIGLLFALDVALTRPAKAILFLGYLVLAVFNTIRLNDAYETLFAAQATLGQLELLQTLPAGPLRKALEVNRSGSRAVLVVGAHAAGVLVVAYGLWQSRRPPNRTAFST